MMPETEVGDRLHAWWALIVRLEPSKINDLLMPLAHLWGCHGLLTSTTSISPEFGELISGFSFPMTLPEINPDEASFKGVTQAILLGLRINLYAGQNIETILVWSEKLMRYCEIFLPSLKRRAFDKWVSAPQAQLGMLHLAAFLLDVYFFNQDPRCLNTVLKLLDLRWIFNSGSIGPGLKKRGDPFICALFQFRLCLLVECALAALNESPEAKHLNVESLIPRQPTWRGASPKADAQPKVPLNVGRVSIPTGDLDAHGASPNEYRDNPLTASKSRAVIFSPSRYSLYTITVTELLQRQGVEIAALVVRQLVNPARFTSEFRRDGVRLLRKIFKKLFLRQRAYHQRNFETIVDLMRQEGIQARTVDALGRSKGIAIHYVNDLNDSRVLALLEKAQPDLVVFTGGGLIRQPVLEKSGAGVVNCHAGILPAYRGMDVIEWAIMEGRLDQVGITVHFMDRGVDTGDILRSRQIAIYPEEGLGQIRDRFEPVMCREIVSACVDFLQGRLAPSPQRPEDGRQYFIMHPRLVEITAEKMESAVRKSQG